MLHWYAAPKVKGEVMEVFRNSVGSDLIIVKSWPEDNPEDFEFKAFGPRSFWGWVEEWEDK